jgi:hypothetical protein
VTEGGEAGFGAAVFGAAGDWADAVGAEASKMLSAIITIGVVCVEFMPTTKCLVEIRARNVGRIARTRPMIKADDTRFIAADRRLPAREDVTTRPVDSYIALRDKRDRRES